LRALGRRSGDVQDLLLGAWSALRAEAGGAGAALPALGKW
jgi:hypothetical protein